MVRRAVLVGDAQCCGTCHHGKLIVFRQKLSGRDSHRRGHHTCDHIHITLVDPFTYGIGTHISAVAVITTKHHYRCSVNLTAVIFDRHVKRFQATRAGQIAVGP